jgi:hypothetical protein
MARRSQQILKAYTRVYIDINICFFRFIDMHLSRKHDFRDESVSEEWVEETSGRK